MARLARVVVPDCPHHITQRGNRRQTTFFCEDDYRAYLDLLVEWCGVHEVRMWAYCLMPNLPAAGRSRPPDRCASHGRGPVPGHRRSPSPLYAPDIRGHLIDCYRTRRNYQPYHGRPRRQGEDSGEGGCFYLARRRRKTASPPRASSDSAAGSGIGVIVKVTVAWSNTRNVGKASGSSPSTGGPMPETVKASTGERKSCVLPGGRIMLPWTLSQTV